MSLQTHIGSLEEKHHTLDAWIVEEGHAPSPDFAKMQTWKKQKLVLKEELERLRSQSRERLDAA